MKFDGIVKVKVKLPLKVIWWILKREDVTLYFNNPTFTFNDMDELKK